MTTSTRPVPAKTGIAISNDEEPGTEGSYAGPVLALLDDRARTERILDRLEVTEDLTERADLASELVRAASRHEYVVERAVLPALEGHIDDSVRPRLASQQPTDPFPLTTSSTIVLSRSERSSWPSSTPSLRRRPRSFPEAGVGKRCMAKWAGTARCGRKVRSASNSGCSASWRVPSQRSCIVGVFPVQRSQSSPGCESRG